MLTEPVSEPVPTRVEVAQTAFDDDQWAGFWRRLVAQVFDGIFVAPIALAIWATCEEPTEPPRYLLLTFFALLGAYHAIFIGSRLVTTLAREQMQVAVVDASSGQPIGFRRACLRSALSLLGSLLIIANLMAAFTERKQSAADLLAHTVVVHYSPKFGRMRALTNFYIIACIIGILASIAIPVHMDMQDRENLATIRNDLENYASALQTHPGATTLDSLGYWPQSSSTRFALSLAGLLYAEFTLRNHKSYMSLYPEYDAATGTTTWRCRSLGVKHYIYCQEPPEANPSSEGLR